MLRRLLATLARDALTSPPLVGALYVLGLAAWAGQRAVADDADFGDARRAEAVASFIAERFAGEISRMKVAIVATALATGLLVGLVADLLVRWREREARHREAVTAPRPSAREARGVAALGGALGESILVVAAVHATLVLWAMADTPQLYAARWYAKGGAPRLVQILATDLLGPHGVLALALACALVYVRPAPLAVLARRARESWPRGGGAALTRRLVGRLGAGLLFAVGLFALAHALSAAPEARAETARVPSAAARPNILLLAADSLRADRLDPRVAPNLSRLADRGTRFEHAYVSIPRTLPSWVTILTGRHAHHHGVRTMFPTREERAKDFDALPSRLARAGWATSAVSDDAGDVFGRLELGCGAAMIPSFDFQKIIRQRALERQTPLLPVLHSRLGRRVLPVMRELAAAADPRLLAQEVTSRIHASKDGPFFMTVFFSTASSPYASPSPFYAKYTDPRYRGRFKYHTPVGLGEELAVDESDARQVRALYDGSVSAIDDAVGRVLAALASEGIADRTIVVVTADHGEALYEGGRGRGHGDHLFGDEGTHVPLVVFDPRLGEAHANRREPRVVRDVDIAPTIYALAGVAAPADLDGRSLEPALRGEALDARPAFAETGLWLTEEVPGLSPDLRIPYPGIMGLTELDGRDDPEIVMRRDMVAVTRMARHRMVRDERMKLVYVPTRHGVRYMLFDTVADPGETSDLAGAQPADVERMKAELWRWMLEDPLMEQRGGFLVPREANAPARRPQGAP